jgi:hypothetical protein
MSVTPTLETLRRRVYVRIWREVLPVVHGGRIVMAPRRLWRVAGTWTDILHEQQQNSDPDADDYPWSKPDLTGLSLLESVTDAVLARIPELERQVEEMEDTNQRYRNRRSRTPEEDAYTTELVAARADLAAARRQVEVALDRWDRRVHLLLLLPRA